LVFKSIISQGLGEVLAVGAHELAPALGLVETGVPARFAYVEGRLRGARVRMASRRFEGPEGGSLTLADLRAEGDERLAMSIVGLPGRREVRPVLGVDVVAMGGTLSLVALDFSPLDENVWAEGGAQVLREVRAIAEQRILLRVTPDFLEDGVAPLSLVAAPPGTEAVAFQAAIHLLRGAGRLVMPSKVEEARCEAAWVRNLAWRRRQVTRRREWAALAHMFGKEFAWAYLEEFLLPDA